MGLSSVSTNQRNKIHPHKFAVWVAIASIIMMFAGLTSAYIVKSGQPGWENVETPSVFWVSTALMVASSITLHLALRYFRSRQMNIFRILLLVTVVLGVGFVILQWIGFEWLWSHGVKFQGASAGQFLYIIFGLHALHVLGGIVALIIMLMKQYLGTTITYNSTPFEVMAIYWHFVDILWLYLFLFFIWIR